MSLLSRILLALGSLSVLFLFAFPMWKIFLEAPQYPEGLEMHIWVNKISGNTEFVLQNFNILNHYIGMAPIYEESFKELKVMPYIAWFFLASGLLIAVFNSKTMLKIWLALFIVGGIVGLTDFYLWLHEFGTELDPNAPIKVPGMTYIPPFIGSKQLLNFHALSLPYFGSLGIALPITTGILILFLERGRKKARIFK